MKARYTKQPNDYGCGPTAIINVLKWSGIRATIKTHYHYLEKLCQTRDEDDGTFHGTQASDFNRAINLVSRERFEVKYRMIPSHTSLLTHLIKGGSAVLLHRNNLGTLHYTFITQILSGSVIGDRPDYSTFQYEVINAFEDTKAVYVISDYELRAWLCRDDQHRPQAWYIKRYKIQRGNLK